MEGLRGKKILVTGGTGFVGSHLVAALVKNKAHIIVSYRSSNPRSYFNLQKLANSVILATCDFKDVERVKDIISKYDVEYIIHLAAQAIVTTAYIHPWETIATNVLGTVNILEAMRLTKTVKGAIITSSDKAYGKSQKTYLEDDPLRGDHPYEVSKSAADFMTHAYAVTYKLPLVTVRFGNIYGPGDLNFSRIIPGIIASALSGKTLKIRSDGKYVRDYVYVRDVVSAYLLLLKQLPELSGTTYNISSYDTLSVINLVKKARRVLKKRIQIRIENSAINEIPYQHLNWKRIAKLGWRPRYRLIHGLKETYRWYKKNRKHLSVYI